MKKEPFDLRIPIIVMILFVLALMCVPIFYRKSAPNQPPGPQALPPSEAVGLWISSQIFDQQDNEKFPLLTSPHPSGTFCFDAQPFSGDLDDELHQLYLQVAESGQASSTEAECRARTESTPPCNPVSDQYSYDYIDRDCFPVSTGCEPTTRFRREGKELRIFLRTFGDKASCLAAPRAS